MFEDIVIVGEGRAGTTLAARLRERARVRITGRELECGGADLVLICTPDAAIARVAGKIDAGPWVAHVSGATRLEALAPHERRFSVHPLQTLHVDGGAAQLDGAFAAVTGADAQSSEAGKSLAHMLGLVPFELDDDDRPMYHAGATVAASFLVTLHRAAADLVGQAGAPPGAVVPLIERVVELGFRPTGPHVRGDDATIESHLAAIAAKRPELEPLYRALSDATELLVAP